MAAKKQQPTDRQLETEILKLLSERAPGKTICPSDVARSLAEDWRPLMDPVREVAFSMVQRGKLQITQKGKVVDGRTAKGPIRLRLLD